MTDGERRVRDERRAAMFDRGMTTQQIATLEGVTKKTMESWRKCRGIAPIMVTEGLYGPCNEEGGEI